MPTKTARSAVRAAVAAATCLVLGPAALGQQFQNQTSTRFPTQPTTEWTNQLSIVDVDLDGDLDIAFANGGNFSSPGLPQPVRLYINDGAGFFTDESAERVGVSGIYRGVEFGDISNNGAPDMALAPDFNGRPRLLINDGKGFFADESIARLPVTFMSSSRVQFADVDNDGDLDLFFVNGGSTNRFGCGPSILFINDGNGVFTNESATRLPPGNVCEPMDAIFGDLNGNFELDIRIGARGSNNSKLYVNNGAGVFIDQSATVPADGTCYSYDLGDINGNGMLDMFGANGGPGNTDILIRNNGDGTWTNISSQISPNPNVDDNDSKFFDYDNDGDLDLIVARLGGTAERIYNNNGAGVFTEVIGLITAVTDSTLDIGVGDLTGDGRLDIVTAQGESGIPYTNKVYINTGPVDTIPPNVVRTEQHADTDDVKGPYVVRAFITDGMTSDRNFFDKGVHLNFAYDGGPVQQVAMRYSGGTIYRGEIPAPAPGGFTSGLGVTIEYFVTARDFANNLGSGETLAFTVKVKGGIPGDLDGDGDVDVFDLLILLGAWGPCDDPAPGSCPADLDGSGGVDVFDLLILLGNWG
jgi:hypothetical protein